jgi:pimeloyl-ACP methyl ester carboxylesterase
MTPASPTNAPPVSSTGARFPDYPFTGHFWTPPQTTARMHYLDEGHGDAIVMVHGNPTWSFYYRRLVLALRDHYRCVVPDHIGCGLSDKPDDAHYEYSLHRRVDDLAALLDHLGLGDDLTLVLHDWGGMIGMAFAARHPERIKRLVILNTSAFHLPPTKALPWSLKLCRSVLGPLLVRGLNAFCRGAVRFCVTRPLPPDVRAAFLAPYDSWANRIAVLRFVQDIPLRPGDRGYDLITEVQDGLHRFRSVPMLLCWGDQDFVFDEHFRAEWQRRFPEAEVHRFADAGHYVLEDAAERIVPLVRDFLARHPIR